MTQTQLESRGGRRNSNSEEEQEEVEFLQRNIPKSTSTAVVHVASCKVAGLTFPSTLKRSESSPQELVERNLAMANMGWQVKLNNKFPRPGTPLWLPRLKQCLPLIGHVPKFAKFWLKKRIANQRVPMDQANLVPYRPIYGAPIGGIGSGTIGRAFGGAFCRFQMIPGDYSYRVVDADQFILRVAPCSNSVDIDSDPRQVWQQALLVAGDAQFNRNASHQTLPTWHRFRHRDSVTYRAIYPRSWTTYDLSSHCGVEATCRQVSPVIAGDYVESCLPCAVFVWEFKNTSNESRDISLAFSFKNGVGQRRIDRKGGCSTEATMLKSSDGSQSMRCSKIHQEMKKMKTVYGLGVLEGKGVSTSHKLQFDPLGDGADLWDEMRSTGHFSSPLDERSKRETGKGEEIGTAVAASCYRVAPGETRQVVMALAWHQPEIHFNTAGHYHRRRYTRFHSDVDSLVRHALTSYDKWEMAIDNWQDPVLHDRTLPEWFRAGVFNELYYVADGGTIWVDAAEKDIEAEAISDRHKQLMRDYGRFAYLEGHEYRMYTTYDVHFNASFALVQLWPSIELLIQYEFARHTPIGDSRPSIFLAGETGVIKVPGCVPHDVGDPDNDPWLAINAYFVHPTDQWKDLNLKFILQTWRDFIYTRDRAVIKDMYPVCRDLVARCLKLWDSDGDCLIENGGAADQTYDNWVMTGPSAYCGGLWLGALRSVELMARELGLKQDAEHFEQTLAKARQAYENRLWNGSYYNFDCHRSNRVRETVMADQLAGYWFLRMCDLVSDSALVPSLRQDERMSDILPADHVKSALGSVVENNFRAISGGQWGVVNGARPNHRGVDKLSIQSEEIWVGINYCLASLLIADGRRADGLDVARSIHSTIYDAMGLGFQTPEAFNLQFKFRSLGYMRPLAIWAMMPALHSTKVAATMSATLAASAN